MIWSGSRAVFVAIIALASLAGLVGEVSAHAVPEQSIPGNGECLIYSPGRVWIRFTERLDPTASSIRVEHDETRTPAHNGSSRITSADGREMEVALIDPLPPGNYTVFFTTLSLNDSHAKPGSFDFRKVAEDDPKANLCALELQIPHDQEAAPTPADIGLRAALFLSLYVGVGGLGFLLFVWDPLLRAGRPFPGAVVREGYGRVMGIALVALPVAAISTIGVFVLTSFRINEGVENATLAEGMSDLASSSIGQAYLARIALLGALSALVAWVAMPRGRGAERPGVSSSALSRYFDRFTSTAPGGFRDRRLLIVAFALGVAAMATQSLSGHPSVFGAISLPVAADLAHQVAVTLWVGGLIHLLVSIYPAIRAAGESQRGALVYLSISRFSAMATIAVPVIVLTGGLTAILLGVDSIEEIFGTTYGRVLALKVGLVLPVVALGAYQKFRLVPELERALPQVRSPSPPNLRLGRFRRATQAEVGLGITVLIVTAILSSTSSLPGQSAPVLSQLVMWEIVDGAICFNVTLIVSPPPTTPRTYNFDVFVTNCAGNPQWIANSTLLFVSPDPLVPQREIPLIPVPGVRDHPNHYLTEQGHKMREPGEWGISVSAVNLTAKPLGWSVSADFTVVLKEA